MAELVLGVDFGTSCTSAGVLIGDRVELVQDSGDDVIPSVVHAQGRGQYDVGRRALMRLLGDPANVVRSVKRIMGLPATSPLLRRFMSRAPFQVVEAGASVALKLRAGDHAPEQIAAVVLDYVRRLAETRFGGRISKAVITTSALPPPGYHDALVRAARIAHLEIVATAPEPIAAALGVGLHGEQRDRRLVICDFGGGTFDVSALIQKGLRFSTIACHGDPALGGDDLDDAVAEALASLVYRKSSFDLHKDTVRWNELLLRCESAKRQLSLSREAPLSMKEAYLEAGTRRDLTVVLDREWVEACWRPLFERAQRTVVELLARARWQASDVDDVALVGGAAQVPMFQRAISSMFPGRVSVSPRADVAVALGAALLTARFGPVQRPVPILEALGA